MDGVVGAGLVPWVGGPPGCLFWILPKKPFQSRNSRSCVAVAAFVVFFGDSVPT